MGVREGVVAGRIAECGGQFVIPVVVSQLANKWFGHFKLVHESETMVDDRSAIVTACRVEWHVSGASSLVTIAERSSTMGR